MDNFVKKSGKGFVAAQIVLRIVAATTTIAGVLFMVTNNQTENLVDIQFYATWKYVGALKFFVGTNVSACCLILVSFLIYITGSWSPKFFTLLLLDLIAMSLVLAGNSAGTTIGLLSKYGNGHIGWASVCGQFEKFCDRAILSLGFSYVGLLALLVLTLLSAIKSRNN